MFLNSKKIPLIPPLFHSNRFISDFKHKAELFNDFFSNQYSLIKNTNHVTDRRLSSVTFSAGDIAKIIQNFNSGKAYGHDNISIRMF